MVTIELRRYPLDLYLRSRAHFDELMREFQLVGFGVASGTSERPVPARLMDLVTEMTSRYAAQIEAIDAVRTAAIARGEQSIDMSYEVPAAVKPLLEQLTAVLLECDEYCRQGEHLLTLATPPDVASFREWNIGEIMRQLDGQPSTPWPGEL